MSSATYHGALRCSLLTPHLTFSHVFLFVLVLSCVCLEGYWWDFHFPWLHHGYPSPSLPGGHMAAFTRHMLVMPILGPKSSVRVQKVKHRVLGLPYCSSVKYKDLDPLLVSSFEGVCNSAHGCGSTIDLGLHLHTQCTLAWLRPHFL